MATQTKLSEPHDIEAFLRAAEFEHLRRLGERAKARAGRPYPETLPGDDSWSRQMRSTAACAQTHL